VATGAWSSPLAQSILFGIAPQDPLTLMATAAVLLGTVLERVLDAFAPVREDYK
jgi:hypothetical protein